GGGRATDRGEPAGVRLPRRRRHRVRRQPHPAHRGGGAGRTGRLPVRARPQLPHAPGGPGHRHRLRLGRPAGHRPRHRLPRPGAAARGRPPAGAAVPRPAARRGPPAGAARRPDRSLGHPATVGAVLLTDLPAASPATALTLWQQAERYLGGGTRGYSRYAADLDISPRFHPQLGAPHFELPTFLVDPDSGRYLTNRLPSTLHTL